MRLRDDIWWRVYSATVAACAVQRQHIGDVNAWAAVDHRHAVTVADANDDVRLAAKQHEREDGTIERVSGK
jgi:hypothetical protein